MYLWIIPSNLSLIIHGLCRTWIWSLVLAWPIMQVVYTCCICKLSFDASIAKIQCPTMAPKWSVAMWPFSVELGHTSVQLNFVWLGEHGSFGLSENASILSFPVVWLLLVWAGHSNRRDEGPAQFMFKLYERRSKPLTCGSGHEKQGIVLCSRPYRSWRFPMILWISTTNMQL